MNPYARPKAYRETSVLTASPEQLVVMLYDGAIRFLRQAEVAMLETSWLQASEKLSRAEAIIDELLATLNMDAGEIAERLQSIYVFCKRASSRRASSATARASTRSPACWRAARGVGSLDRRRSRERLDALEALAAEEARARRRRALRGARGARRAARGLLAALPPPAPPRRRPLRRALAAQRATVDRPEARRDARGTELGGCAAGARACAAMRAVRRQRRPHSALKPRAAAPMTRLSSGRGRRYRPWMAAHSLDPSRPWKSSTPPSSALEKAIIGASARQQAIAENLANVDTPGYQRDDVDFHRRCATPWRRAAGLAERHVLPPADAAAPVRADGTTVDVDAEAAAQARNGLEYEALVRSPRRASTSSSRDGRADGPLRRPRHLRQRPHRRAPADGRHGREPRQRPVDAYRNGQGPYRRKEVVLQEAGVGVGAAQLRRLAAAPPAACRSPASSRTRRPSRRVYDPGHPDADAQGYVTMPNVNPVTEMIDLIGASRAYEANVTAMQTAKSMFTRTLDLLK